MEMDWTYFAKTTWWEDEGLQKNCNLWRNIKLLALDASDYY